MKSKDEILKALGEMLDDNPPTSKSSEITADTPVTITAAELLRVLEGMQKPSTSTPPKEGDDDAELKI